MAEENLLLTLPPEEAVPVGGLLLAECERIISVLGEDGVHPLSAAELKKLSEKAGAKARDPFRPVLMGDVLLDWAEADSIGLHELKDMLPLHETIMMSYASTLIGMGAQAIKRSMLVTAGNDKRLLDTIEDDALREGIIAARLKMLGNYIERKLYALSLGVMAYQE